MSSDSRTIVDMESFKAFERVEELESCVVDVREGVDVDEFEIDTFAEEMFDMTDFKAGS